MTNLPGDNTGVAFRNDDTGGGLLAPGNESRSSISNLRLALFVLRLIAPPRELLYGEEGLLSPPRPKREPGGVVGKKLAPHLFRLAIGSCSIIWGLPRTSIGRFRVTQVILRPSLHGNTTASFKRASRRVDVYVRTYVCISHAILICDVMCYEDVYMYNNIIVILGDGQVQGRHKLGHHMHHTETNAAWGQCYNFIRTYIDYSRIFYEFVIGSPILNTSKNLANNINVIHFFSVISRSSSSAGQ